MEDPRIISALFIFLKMAYYNVLINSNGFVDHRRGSCRDLFDLCCNLCVFHESLFREYEN